MEISEKFLEEFYEHILLPEFGFREVGNIVWDRHERIGPDDYVHYFYIDNKKYVLVFRDYDVFSDEELIGLINIPNATLHYIDTISGWKKLHSNLILPRQNKYIPGITGTFVLLKISSV